MKLFNILLVMIMLTGCVNLDKMTEAERQDYLDKKERREIARTEKLAEAYDAYRAKAAACDGYMIIRKGPTHQPTATDLHLAYCSSGPVGIFQ